jgi:hypothetical protein
MNQGKLDNVVNVNPVKNSLALTNACTRESSHASSQHKELVSTIPLNNDLWNLIFDYLPQKPKTFAILQCVQKQWSIDIFVPKFNFVIPMSKLPNYTKYKKLHTIGISFGEKFMNKAVLIEHTKNLLLRQKNIRNLDLQYCDGINLTNFKLNVLILNSCKNIIIPTCVNSLKLLFCHTNFCHLFQYPYYFLTSLHLVDENITNNQLQLFENLPSLHTLKLLYCNQITNVEDLRDCYNLRDIAILSENYVYGINECSQINNLAMEYNHLEINFGLSNLFHLQYLFLVFNGNKVQHFQCKDVSYVILVDVYETLDEIAEFYYISKEFLMLNEDGIANCILWIKTLFVDEMIESTIRKMLNDYRI